MIKYLVNATVVITGDDNVEPAQLAERLAFMVNDFSMYVTDLNGQLADVTLSDFSLVSITGERIEDEPTVDADADTAEVAEVASEA
jgi:hypothetical protein